MDKISLFFSFLYFYFVNEIHTANPHKIKKKPGILLIKGFRVLVRLTGVEHDPPFFSASLRTP